MTTEEIVYLEYDEAVWFHFELMWEWNETHIGVDRRDLVESALARPKHAQLMKTRTSFAKPQLCVLV